MRHSRSRRWRALLAAALSLTFCGTAKAAELAGSPAELLGVWRGTSLCTDRERAPACHDEQVIYTFVPSPDGSAAAVRLEADKVVDGERGRMGEMDFAYRKETGRWESEFQNARVHALWSFEVQGRSISGELLELPSRARIRKVSVEKDSAAPVP